MAELVSVIGALALLVAIIVLLSAGFFIVIKLFDKFL